ncbi:MAG: heavy metal-responsive transcriptional regulator [Armatimonadota bacterium]
MRIGEFAKEAGVNPKTVRYYEELGLLPPAPRTESGYRQYAEKDIERLEFIRSAKGLGVSLDEIKEVLAFRDRGTYPCPYVLTLINAKVEEIELRIQGLRMLARDLRRLRKAADSIPPKESAKKARFCHIIENQKLLQPLERRLARKNLRGAGP